MRGSNKYKPNKSAVKRLKRRAGIKSFKELGLYDRPKKRKKPTIKNTIGRSIGLGYM